MAPMSFGATFLTNPDLFPARRSGEPWGDRELILDLPGGPYRFFGLNADQEAGVLGKFGKLRLPSAPGETVDTPLFRASPADFLELDVRGWEYGLDMDAGPDSLRIAGLDLLGRLDWRPGLAGTTSRMGLERGLTVLSDDLNALLPAAPETPENTGTVRLAGLPFTGDLGGDGGAGEVYPLRGLYRLEKDTEDVLRPLGRAEAVALLLACSPFLNADPHRRGELLSTLLSLAGRIPAYSLRFSLRGGMWDILTPK
jgi:hypothetical protein